MTTARRNRPWRHGFVALLAILPFACAAMPTPASAPVPAAAPSAAMPSGDGSPIEDASAEALWWGNFEQLETQYDAVRNSPDLVDGGKLRLEWFRSGLGRIFNASGEHDPYFAQLETMTHAWSVEHPRSPLAQLLYARALYARGLRLRGGDYASKTPAAAMQAFDHYLGLAEAQLADHADLLRNESTTYLYRVMFARWHLPYEDIHTIAMEGLGKNRRDLAIFEELAYSALPRWRGSAQRFDEVVHEAVRKVDGYPGMALYAWLYDADSYSFEGEMFDVSDVDWPTLRQGFRDYLGRYPNAWVLNRFARQACLAQDKPTTRQLLDQIGAAPLERAWDDRLDACRRWARSP